MRAPRALGLLAALALGCGGGGGHDVRPTAAVRPPPPRPQATGPAALEAAPGWVHTTCDALPPGILCPRRTPAGLAPTPNAALLRPGRDGYVLEGQAARHWVWIAVPRTEGLRGYVPLRPRGAARIRGRRARWVAGGPRSGILTGHVALVWAERGRTYAVGVRGDGAGLRRRIRAVARAMAG